MLTSSSKPQTQTQTQTKSFTFKFLSTQDGIAFAISSICHLSACLFLAVVLISHNKVGKQELTFSFEDNTSMIELQLDSAMVEIPIPDFETRSEAESLGSESMLKELVLQADANLEQVYEAAEKSGNRTDSSLTRARMASSVKTAESEVPRVKSRTTFFGAEAYGDRFVFVIDSSKSMLGYRWESLCVELVRALHSLSPDQEFFVVSFDSSAHPMLGLMPPKQLFLKPTSRNVKKVQNWLRSIVQGHETHPAGAMAIALQLKPDAIFLLSDGEIRDDTVVRLREWNVSTDPDEYRKVAIPIHTVLLHSEVGYATLEKIAVENQGTFTPVNRHP